MHCYGDSLWREGQLSSWQTSPTQVFDKVKRTQLREQAIKRLQADLELAVKMVETGVADATAAILYWLNVCQKDSDLASIREQKALLKLPPSQRVACNNLWKEVAALREKAEKAAKSKSN